MMKPPYPNERALDICRRRRQGETYATIARQYGVTPVRVRQIYLKADQRLRTLGLRRNHGP